MESGKIQRGPANVRGTISRGEGRVELAPHESQTLPETRAGKCVAALGPPGDWRVVRCGGEDLKLGMLM